MVVNSIGDAASYGFDVDTFDVSTLLSPGQTSATTQFSTGGDLVLLLAQVVSVTSQPTVDLSLTKTHTGNFAAGTNGVYTLRVSNAAGEQRGQCRGRMHSGDYIRVRHGGGWSCSAAGRRHLHAPTATDPGQSLLDSRCVAAGGTPCLHRRRGHECERRRQRDEQHGERSDHRRFESSTSTKTVSDLNGGEADAGGTLRYTITLVETGGVACRVPVAPASTTGSASSAPPGATVPRRPPCSTCPTSPYRRTARPHGSMS